MLDSSVRVSRRAGWKTDLLALDCRAQRSRRRRNCPTRAAGSTARSGRHTTARALSTTPTIRRASGHRRSGVRDPIDALRSSSRREHITRDNERVTAWLPCSRHTLPLCESFHRSGHHRRALRKCTRRRSPSAHEQSSQTARTQRPLRRAESTLGSDFVAPPACLQTVSRPVELSLQSSLQLSFTVLVCYRSRSDI